MSVPVPRLAGAGQLSDGRGQEALAKLLFRKAETDE